MIKNYGAPWNKNLRAANQESDIRGANKSEISSNMSPWAPTEDSSQDSLFSAPIRAGIKMKN